MKIRKLLTIFLLIIAFAPIAKASDVIYNKEDSLIYIEYIKVFEKQSEKPISDLFTETAKHFLGKPYISSTLEMSDKERLVINLREFDCTTLIENCLALAETLKSKDYSFDNFCRMLTSVRYRNGEIDGYPSRLHYMTDWIYENEKHNYLEDITSDIGGQKISKQISFMSQNPDKYKYLKDNTANTSKIKEVENSINKRDGYYVLSVSDIANHQTNIQNGDIILFATSIKGLDYSHVGIAYRVNGILHFIHASSRYKEVIIEKKTLLNYCKDSKSCTGISILRPNAR